MSNVTLLRMSELTRRLGIARSTVYKMMKERGFPRPVKLTGRVVAWREVDVVAYLDRHAPSPSLYPTAHPASHSAARCKRRSEERRVGKEGGSTCRSRWSPSH